MNNFWKYTFILEILIIIVITCLIMFNGKITYFTKIYSCKKQLTDSGFTTGVVEGPLKLIGMKEIATVGCAYGFKRDVKKLDLINFDFMVFDGKGVPYVYGMKIDGRLSVCRRGIKETNCGLEKVEEYKDFPDGKVVIVGIINDLIPNKEAEDQPDLKFLSKLKQSLKRKSWYPLQLFNKRIQIWSLAY